MKMKVIHKNRDVDSRSNSSHSQTSSALVLRPPEPARYQPFIDKKEELVTSFSYCLPASFYNKCQLGAFASFTILWPSWETTAAI